MSNFPLCRSALLAVPLALATTLLTVPPAAADVETWTHFRTLIPIDPAQTAAPERLEVYASSRWGLESGLKQSVLQIGPRWVITPNYSTGIFVRGAANRSGDNLSQEVRLRWEHSLKADLGDWELGSRHRLEWQSKSQASIDRFSWRYRPQFQVAYEPADWPVWPYLAQESFLSLNGDGFRQFRFSAGVTRDWEAGIGTSLEYVYRPKVGSDQTWGSDHLIVFTLLYGPDRPRARAESQP